ncbi:MAG: UTP--glucose-1-phosphate uridylyltransferase GalU [Pseudomonadota bacterium]
MTKIKNPSASIKSANRQSVKIKKAVFPVAGLGTRFLPATKATPKEMLPVVDKPLIEYAVEEAIAAGITELIFITSYSKRAIEDHFDSHFELETRLQQSNKTALLEKIRATYSENVSFIYIRQPEPKGLGDAILCAKPAVNNEPFAVLLADDLIESGARPCLTQMMSVYEKTGGSVVAVEKIAPEDSDKYGIVDIQTHLEDIGSYAEASALIEKPTPAQAPSSFGIVGRYILSQHIFAYLEHAEVGAGNEIQLTDAIARLIEEGVYAYRFQGKRYDCGSKLGYLKATVNYALKHPELADGFRAYIKQLNTINR